MKALQFSVSIPQWIALKAAGLVSHKPFYKGPLATVKLTDLPEPGLPTDEWVRVKSILCGLRQRSESDFSQGIRQRQPLYLFSLCYRT